MELDKDGNVPRKWGKKILIDDVDFRFKQVSLYCHMLNTKPVSKTLSN